MIWWLTIMLCLDSLSYVCTFITYFWFAVTREFLFLIKGYAAAKLLQSCLTLCDPTRLPRPWDSPDKNTGVGCHFLLQCIKVKSESEVTQACPTLSYPTDCSLPCSSVHGIFQARVLEWVDIAFSNERLYVYVIILSCWCLIFKCIFKTLHLYSPSFKITIFDSLFCISLFCIYFICSLWLETILLLSSCTPRTRIVCGWFPAFSVEPFIS